MHALPPPGPYLLRLWGSLEYRGDIRALGSVKGGINLFHGLAFCCFVLNRGVGFAIFFFFFMDSIVAMPTVSDPVHK